MICQNFDSNVEKMKLTCPDQCELLIASLRTNADQIIRIDRGKEEVR